MVNKRSRGDLFRSLHGPTWLVAIAIYGGWIVLTLTHERLPLPLLVVLGGIVIAWHGSLQHETIHGHPAGPRWVGSVLGAPPLSLWLPYEVYRDTHRRHHATTHLTDPAHDPEAPEATQRTALGRLVLGPVVSIGSFLATELRNVARNAPGHRRAWAIHAISVVAVLVWLGFVGLPLWKYVLAFVYPGASLTLLRSFAEHRPDPLRERRTAVIEAGWFFSLLFLNNNLHVMHHAAPRAPWFDLPRLWARERAAFEKRAPDLLYPGYLAIARQTVTRPLASRDEVG